MTTIEISFEALRKVQLEEKRSPSLTLLSDDFYSKYTGLMHQQEGQLRQGFSLEAASVHESTRRVLRDVWERRQQKLALKALQDAKGGQTNAQGLATEEQHLYNALYTLFVQGENVFAQRGVGPELTEPAKEILASMLVRVLTDLPAFVGPDGQSHGPFRADQVVELPSEVATLLQRRGAATAVSAALTANA